jgi:hypothetical protein
MSNAKKTFLTQALDAAKFLFYTAGPWVAGPFLTLVVVGSIVEALDVSLLFGDGGELSKRALLGWLCLAFALVVIVAFVILLRRERADEETNGRAMQAEKIMYADFVLAWRKGLLVAGRYYLLFGRRNGSANVLVKATTPTSVESSAASLDWEYTKTLRGSYNTLLDEFTPVK